MTNWARRLVAVIALPALLICGWWWYAWAYPTFYLPPPGEILAAAGQVWTADRVRTDVLPSLGRLAVGYLVAMVAGTGVGLMVGRSRPLRELTEPGLEFLRAIPPPVLVPILILFAGIGDQMKISVIAAGAVWPILLNTAEGVRAVDPVMIETARSYRIGRARSLRRVILPAAGPQIFAGLRQALSVAIILMVISEMFAASNGLGFTIVAFQRSFAIPEMWSGTILLGLLGFGLAILLRAVERRVLFWHIGLRAAARGQ